MSILLLALKVIGAVAVGWTLAKSFPEAPAGTDPNYWTRALRVYRRRRARRRA